MPPVDLPAPASVSSGATALLVFARSTQRELGLRAWPQRFAALFNPLSRVRSVPQDIEVHLFVEDAGVAEAAQLCAANYHRQIGRGFAERLRHATETIAAAGFERMIVVGSDCPELAWEDIVYADEQLRSGVAAVWGPDHRGGVYLIGLHARDRTLLDGIEWQRDTDFEQLRSLYRSRRTALLPVKMDLDRWSDLQLYARSSASPLRRWLARELATLRFAGNWSPQVWIDLARQSAQARRLTSPPVFAAA